MNEPVLSPEESQALMEALQEGDSPREASVGEIDLTGGERPLRAAQPFFEKVGAQLAATWRRTLATTYRLSSEVLAEPTEIVSFGDLRRRLDAGMIVGRLEAHPSAAPVLLFLGPSFVSSVVDHGFGGNGEDTSSLMAREPTALERNLLRRLCMLLATDVTTAWKKEAHLDLTFLHLEGRNDLPTMLPDNTALLLLPFRMSFGGSQDEISLALTAGSVDTVPQKAPKDLSASARPPDEDLLRRLHTWPIWVSSELGRCTLTVDELLGLEPGAVLRLDAMAQEPVRILLNGVPKLLGRPVVSRNSIATRVEGWLEIEAQEGADSAGETRDA